MRKLVVAAGLAVAVMSSADAQQAWSGSAEDARHLIVRAALQAVPEGRPVSTACFCEWRSRLWCEAVGPRVFAAAEERARRYASTPELVAFAERVIEATLSAIALTVEAQIADTREAVCGRERDARSALQRWDDALLPAAPADPRR